VLFNSLPFLLFLPCVLLLFYGLPHRYRWVLVLLASYFFYGFWKIEYLSLIVFSTTLDYFAARYIYTQSGFKRKMGLAVSLMSNLGLLAFFKYSGWFINDIAFPLGLLTEQAQTALNNMWSFVLPVGISFYTFQTMGYTIDVYYDRIKPEKNLLKLALFVSYFPQLVAGPIERFDRLHAQLFAPIQFDYANFQAGGRMILYGLFIKMCVADNISPIVDQVFAQTNEASIAQLWSGMGLFGIQIYADFHGYSLIAIGTARLFGVHLMTNFRAPYLSLSIREFWSRWHISLSTWFRDYVFIPMGGNRVSNTKLAVNIAVVFLVSGLWHGANWTFVIWGALHGGAYLIERFTLSKWTSGISSTLRWAVTMLVVFVAWVFFRAENFDSAIEFIQGLILNESSGIDLTWSPLVISFVGLFLLSDVVFGVQGFEIWLDSKSKIKRWALYSMLIYFITGFAGVVEHPFIYFQF